MNRLRDLRAHSRTSRRVCLANARASVG
jgi:hypothetical protein